MYKTIFSHVGNYRKQALLAPTTIIGEVIMEVTIPAVMARIIDNGVKAGGNVQKRILYRLQYPAQAAFKLRGGAAGGGGALRVDKVYDGLRFREVKPSVQEGAFRELPGGRLTRSGVEERQQDFP